MTKTNDSRDEADMNTQYNDYSRGGLAGNLIECRVI